MNAAQPALAFVELYKPEFPAEMSSVAVDRSKNCAAMRNAPIRSPLNQAVRIWSVLLRMSSTSAANPRAADDLAWLDEQLDGLVRNIRTTAVTSEVSRQCPL
jgi:hypothetical protein